MSGNATARRGPLATLPIVLSCAALFGGCSGAPVGSGVAPSSPVVDSPAPSELTIDVPSLTNVTLVPERASRTVIGPDGGTLEAGDASGTAYRLDIPPGALAEVTALLAVPVATIAGLPAEAKVGGGVHLEPEGLVLREAATLTITPSSATDGAILPFAYRGDLVAPFRYPVLNGGSSVSIEIVHFSGYGLLVATNSAISAAELGLAMDWEPPDGPTDRALSEIANVIDGSAPDRAQVINDALRRWLDDGIGPLVATFLALETWDENEYASQSVRIRAEYGLWDYVGKLLTLTGALVDPAHRNRSIELAASAAAHGITVANTQCAVSPPALLAHLRIPDLARWLEWAVERGLQGLDPWLDPAHVADNLCVDVAINRSGFAIFPTDIAPGDLGALALEVGLKAEGGSDAYGVGSYDVTVAPTGTIPAGILTAATNLAGGFTHEFRWDPAADSMRLGVTVCLPAPLESVCDEEIITRGSGSTAGPSAGPLTCLHRVTGPGEGHQLEHPMSVSYGDLSGGMTARAGEVSINARTGGTYDGLSIDAFRLGGPAEVLIRVDPQAAIRGSLEVSVLVNGQAFTRPGELASEFTVAPVAGGDGDVVSIEIRVSLDAASGDALTVTASPRGAAGASWQPVALCAT